jgi:hypothetical protein
MQASTTSVGSLFDVHPCCEPVAVRRSSVNGYNDLGVGDPRRRVAITRDRRGAARSQAGAAEAMRTVVRMSRLCEDTTDVRRSKLEMKKKSEPTDHTLSIQSQSNSLRLAMDRYTITNYVFYK